MDETKSSSFGFNKRRAEGKDENDTPKKNLQLKTRMLNPTNTIAYVQIMGTGTDTQDTSPSVLLFFDRQRFILNAGEGLQRFCTEHKIKLAVLRLMPFSFCGQIIAWWADKHSILFLRDEQRPFKNPACMTA